MHGGEAQPPEERVRRALAQLAADPASATDVPVAVAARIGAALRAASPPAAHAARPPVFVMTRPRLVALIMGIAAAAIGLAVAVAALLHDPAGPRFPQGPTAERITVTAPPPARDTPGAVTRR